VVVVVVVVRRVNKALCAPGPEQIRPDQREKTDGQSEWNRGKEDRQDMMKSGLYIDFIFCLLE
jgi:hypothetical protein